MTCSEIAITGHLPACKCDTRYRYCVRCKECFSIFHSNYPEDVCLSCEQSSPGFPNSPHSTLDDDMSFHRVEKLIEEDPREQERQRQDD